MDLKFELGVIAIQYPLNYQLRYI